MFCLHCYNYKYQIWNNNANIQPVWKDERLLFEHKTKSDNAAYRTKIADEVVDKPEHGFQHRIHDCPGWSEGVVEEGAECQTNNEPFLFYPTINAL